MWQALSADTQAAIERARQAYGDVLFDYCHSTLAAADAELAACGALLSAHAHADRLSEPENLRAWLYALARAHCTMQATASSGTPTGPGAAAGTDLEEALAALPALQRELLELSVRHGLTNTEIALIFDAGAIEIEHLVDDAADHLETLLGSGPALTAAHTAADLLQHLPIRDAPATMAARLTCAEPLPPARHGAAMASPNKHSS
ncbi:alanine-rich protein [[Actinomadura] parvosata subsp. kistnae]|uniref:RNA polymerase sigma factor n=1 Tax=[Actinomadura] parvosata TaxID=1955412 RepID=UPI000D2816B5|nr:alanine-rich protein [Actinomadura parvosata subsp. kistnae]